MKNNEKKMIEYLKKRVYVAIILIMIITNYCAYSQSTISLNQAITTTLERNIKVKIALLNKSFDEQNLNQANYNRLPNLTSSTQTTLNYGRNIDPSTNQYVVGKVFGLTGLFYSQLILFHGGALKNLLLENKLIVESDKSYGEKVKNDLIISVVTTYLQALTNQDLLKSAHAHLDLAKQELERINQNYVVGNNKAEDITQAKVQVANAELSETIAQNQLDISILTLKQYMEIDQNLEIRLKGVDAVNADDYENPFKTQAVFERSLITNPDVQLAKFKEQIAFATTRAARSDLYPTISLFGLIGSNYSSLQQRIVGTQTDIYQVGYLYSNPSQDVVEQYTLPVYGKYPLKNQLKDNLNEAIGITLSAPIFGRFQAKTTLAKTIIKYQEAELNTQLAKDDLNKIISQAILDIKSANKKFKLAKQTYEASKEAFEIIHKRFEIGLSTALEYNISLESLNRSESDLIESKYFLIFRRKIIDYYQGNPLDL